jgi:hypothetical protein
MHAKSENSDRAKLRIVWSVPDGEYNRDVEIEAKQDGIWIDDYIFIPWEWIQTAYSIFHPPVREALQETAQHKCCSQSSS